MALNNLFKKIWFNRKEEAPIAQEEVKAVQEYEWPPKDWNNQVLQKSNTPAIKNLYNAYKDYIATEKNFSIADFNILSFAFKNNKKLELNLTPENFDELFKICVPENGLWSIENFYILSSTNKSEGLNLRQDQIDYLLKNTDSNKFSSQIDGFCLLSEVLRGNAHQNINLTKEQINELMVKTDFSKEKYSLSSIIDSALAFSQKNNIEITSQQWDFLIKNCKLGGEITENFKSHSVLTLFGAIYYKDVNLSFEQIDYIFKDSGLDMRKIEALNNDKEKINFIYDSIGIPKDFYHENFGNIILAGYNMFKPQKLQQLAIEEEKQTLNNKIPSMPSTTSTRTKAKI